VKEDVLEQIIDDYLQFLGYFTVHNVKFRPDPEGPGFLARDDSVHSDIDILAFHPLKRGPERVRVISCKSWQSGFRADLELGRLRGEKKNAKRESWRRYRELWKPKWATAFRTRIQELTGAKEFHYSLAVTRLVGDGAAWEQDPTIRKNLGRGCRFSFLALDEIWGQYLNQIELTPAPSEIGRLAQLLKAAGVASDQ
jgi:hypothetical protein